MFVCACMYVYVLDERVQSHTKCDGSSHVSEGICMHGYRASCTDNTWDACAYETAVCMLTGQVTLSDMLPITHQNSVCMYVCMHACMHVNTHRHPHTAAHKTTTFTICYADVYFVYGLMTQARMCLYWSACAYIQKWEYTLIMSGLPYTLQTHAHMQIHAFTSWA